MSDSAAVEQCHTRLLEPPIASTYHGATQCGATSLWGRHARGRHPASWLMRYQLPSTHAALFSFDVVDDGMDGISVFSWTSWSVVKIGAPRFSARYIAMAKARTARKSTATTTITAMPQPGRPSPETGGEGGGDFETPEYNMSVSASGQSRFAVLLTSKSAPRRKKDG